MLKKNTKTICFGRYKFLVMQFFRYTFKIDFKIEQLEKYFFAQIFFC